MEIIPKAPHEIAAQMLHVYPLYSEYAMPKDHAERLDEQAKGLQAEVEGMRPNMLADDELAHKLTDLKTRATKSGVWRADKGEGSDERLDFAVQEKSVGATRTKKLRLLV